MVRLRRKLYYAKSMQRLFQFHMVRLRPSGYISSKIASIISIPHGTIKTALISASLATIPSFQFHMVRLRHLAVVARTVDDEFQFHMVRLRLGIPE